MDYAADAPQQKEPRAAAVKAYLAQLAMMLTGATFHCGSTPGFTGDFAPLTSCLDMFRRGQGPHRTWGVSMAGLGRMASIVDMVEDVAKRGLNGSYAETGVWRGGMTILATAAFQLYGMPTRPVYLCDSFDGACRLRAAAPPGPNTNGFISGTSCSRLASVLYSPTLSGTACRTSRSCP